MGAAALPVAVGTQVAGSALNWWAAGQAGKSQANYYSYLANTSRMNAGLTRAAGKSNIAEVGYQEKEGVRKLNENLRETLASQRVAEAGSGPGVGSKTAEQIASSTLTKGKLDEMALRYNSALKQKNIRIGAEISAFNDDNQAAGYGFAGQNALQTARVNQASAILGGAGQVAKTWYMGNNFGG